MRKVIYVHNKYKLDVISKQKQSVFFGGLTWKCFHMIKCYDTLKYVDDKGRGFDSHHQYTRMEMESAIIKTTRE